jgi:hypothetical protein
MQAALGVAVPATLIHTARTIAATAAELEKLQGGGDGSGGAAPLPPVVATAWPDTLRPLSANQEQMWVLYKSGGQTSAYNIPLGLTLEGLGGVDMAALQRALDALAQRHETLRCGGWAVTLPSPGVCGLPAVRRRVPSQAAACASFSPRLFPSCKYLQCVSSAFLLARAALNGPAQPSLPATSSSACPATSLQDAV